MPNLLIHFKDNSFCGGFDPGPDPIETIKNICHDRGWQLESVRGYSTGDRQRIPFDIGIERTRTNAGEALFNQIHNGRNSQEALEEVVRRLEVRVENVREGEFGDNPAGEVWTRLDGGEWVNEGFYILSCRWEVIEPEFIEIQAEIL